MNKEQSDFEFGLNVYFWSSAFFTTVGHASLNIFRILNEYFPLCMRKPCLFPIKLQLLSIKFLEGNDLTRVYPGLETVVGIISADMAQMSFTESTTVEVQSFPEKAVNFVPLLSTSLSLDCRVSDQFMLLISAPVSNSPILIFKSPTTIMLLRKLSDI